MRLLDVCLIGPRTRLGEPSARLGVPLLDEYLRFVAGRCRPNTVLAAAYDLKVFFTMVGKDPADVRPADVLAFVTAQRTGRRSIDGVLKAVDDDEVGVSLRTARRRLSSVSGLYAFLQRWTKLKNAGGLSLRRQTSRGRVEVPGEARAAGVTSKPATRDR
jgi:hypothetical protein